MIRENAVIIRATHADHETSVGNGNFIMTGARLSHDVTVGNRCIIGNGSQISGKLHRFRLLYPDIECADAGKYAAGKLFGGARRLPFRKGYTSLYRGSARTD